MKTIFWSLALVSLIHFTPAFARAQEKDDTEQPIQIEDRLTDADPKDKSLTNSAHKVHVIHMLAGKIYQVDLMKKDNQQPMDPFLRIEDSTGKELARDDDSGGNLNARIRFTPAKDDNFRIIATCLFGTGEYLLKITPTGKVQKIAPGKVFDVKENLELNANLTPDSPRDNGKPAQAFSVKLVAAKSYIIDLESSEFDAYLRVRDAAGQELAHDDDSGNGSNARLTFTPPKDDTYQVVATCFGGRVGAFTLKIRDAGQAAPPAKVPVPGKVQDIPKEGLKWDAALTREDGKDSVRKNSFAKIFQVKMTKDKTYTIDLESNAFDSFLRVEDSNDRQLAFNDDGGEGFNSRLQFRAPEDGTYRLIATSLSPGLGNFTLRIREN